MFLITISSISLSLENPLNDPEGKFAYVLSRLDLAITSVFSLEVILKIIACGFVLNGPKSYIR